MYTIGIYDEKDKYDVELMTKKAFNNLYEPGCNEHLLAHNLRNSSSIIPELDLVMKDGDKLIGSIMLSKATIKNDDELIEVLTVSPFCIANEYQGKGLGKQLMQYALNEASRLGWKVVLLYGFPAIYSNFNFKQAALYNISAPDGSYPSALHVIELEKGFLTAKGGAFYEEFMFETQDDELRAFDKDFPELEKEELPCQLDFLNMLESFVSDDLIGTAFNN